MWVNHVGMLDDVVRKGSTEPNKYITHVWEAFAISESYDPGLLRAGQCKGEKDLEQKAGRLRNELAGQEKKNSYK